MKAILRKLRNLTRKEDGSATIEFCIWFPFFIMLFGSAFEASLITTRQVLLAGAVDRTVRDLQLGNLGSPTHAELRTIICNIAGFIPDCTSSLHIELERISTSDFEFRLGEVTCIDKSEETDPAVNFTNGTTNDLMLITVCASFSPMVPVTGLGLKLPKIGGSNEYGLTAFSAYVVEPA